MSGADSIIRAAHFSKGRPEPISLVVVHTSENPTAAGVARAVAGYFASPPAWAPVASAHFVVGPETTVGCVDEADTAWHAAPVNFRSIGVEHTGYARFTATDWAGIQQQAMLARSAELVAEICGRHQIPVSFVDAAGLLRGDAGITTHAEVSAACRLAIASKVTGTVFTNQAHPAVTISNHTDPGTAFPIDAYLELVRASGHGVAPAVDPGEPPDRG